MTAQDILLRWGQCFAQSQFYTDPIVNISWWIIYLLKDLVDAANYLLQTVYKMSDFIFTDTVMNFIRSFNAILWIPFVIALLILGYTLIFHTSDTRPKVVQNLLIAVMVICALPTMMISIKDMTFAGIEMVNNYSISEGGEQENSNVSYAEKIVLDNLADLKYMEANQWDENILIHKKNNLTSMDAVEITERLWADKVSSTDDVFDKYLKYDENGNISVEKIDRSSWIWLLSPVYYRYNFNFLSMFLALIASAFALFFTAYKVARLIWELAVHQLLAMIFAASDLTGGQRIKQVLRSIASIFVVLFLTSILLQFFQLGVQYINNQNIDGLVRGFILLFWALACVDAPNSIERILGIDAGISSGFRTFFGVVHGTRTAVGLGITVGGVGKKAGRAYTAASGRSGMFKERFQQWSTRNKNPSVTDRKSAKNNNVNGFNSSTGKGQQSNHQNTNQYHSDMPNNQEKNTTVNGYTVNGKSDNSSTTNSTATIKENQKKQPNNIIGYQIPTKNPQQTAIHKPNNHTSINNANHKLSQNHTSVTGNHSSHNGIYDNSNGIQRQSEKNNSSASKQFKTDKNNLKNPPEQNQKGK